MSRGTGLARAAIRFVVSGLAATGVAWLALGCGPGSGDELPGHAEGGSVEPGHAEGGSVEPARAPVGIQGDVVLEPPVLRIGQAAWLEVAVVTPPEHRLAPVEPPEELPGLWLLEVERPSVTREPERWIHRTRFRIRARTTGSLVWPAQTLRVETSEGEALAVALPERAFEVIEVSREWPDRLEPFGVRRRVAPASLRGALVPAAAGALAALAAVGLVVLVRRARRDEAAPRASGDGRDAWRAAHATLAAAEAGLAEDPAVAADRASAALRLFLTERFHAAADTATTEELAARVAPWGLVRTWPEVIALLRRLDGVRFRPRASGTSADEEVRAALRDAREWLGASPPRVLRR